MNFAEVLLRIGCALVGWIVIYTYSLWTMVLRQITCSADGDALWRLLLGFAPFAVAFAFALTASTRLVGVHNVLRLLAYPFVVIGPLALWSVGDTFIHATVQQQAICEPWKVWHPWWAPVHLLVLTIVGWQILRANRVVGKNQ